MTVVKMLLEKEKYSRHLEALIEAFRHTGTTDLQPNLQTIFNVNWTEFERDWMDFCQKKLGPKR